MQAQTDGPGRAHEAEGVREGREAARLRDRDRVVGRPLATGLGDARHQRHRRGRELRRPAAAGRGRAGRRLHREDARALPRPETHTQKVRPADPAGRQGVAGGRGVPRAAQDPRGRPLYDLRGRARPVLRPAAHLRDERAAVRGEPVRVQRRHGGPGQLLLRGGVIALRPEAQAPGGRAPEPRQPRNQKHVEDLRLRGRGAAQVRRHGAGALPRVLLLAAAGRRRGRQGLRDARGPQLGRRRDAGGHREDRPQPRAAGPGPHVRPALERPAGGRGPVALEARRGPVVRAGRDAAVPGDERPEPGGAVARGAGRGLRAGARRRARDRLLGAQLLRRHGQQGGLHPPGRRPGAPVHGLRRRAAPARAAHGLRVVSFRPLIFGSSRVLG
mmetsp:Transcript_26452/g.79335  ORF Transcript_26452/g.79335 Transcript_26452/m.79335 type:complete len:386 (+) Transcript_26452:494-1651(+)